MPAAPTEHTITFYANGFTVDDGPLRSPGDPENAAHAHAPKTQRPRRSRRGIR